MLTFLKCLAVKGLRRKARVSPAFSRMAMMDATRAHTIRVTGMRMHRRHVQLTMAAVCSLFAIEGAALAAAPSGEPVQVRLSVVRSAGAESCPSASAVASAVRGRLGRNPFAESAADQVEVTFAPTSDVTVLRADIRVRDENGASKGDRTLHGAGGAGCEALGAAVALAIALHIDPDAALAAPKSPPPPPPSPVPATAAPAAPPAPPAPAPAPGPPRGMTLVGGVGLLSEAVPGVSAVAQIGAGAEVVAGGRLWVRLTGMLAPEQRTADSRFAFGMTAGFVGACFDALRVGKIAEGPALSLAPCVHVGVGEIHSVVFSLLPTEPGTRVWVSGAAELLLRVSPFTPAVPLDIELGLGFLTPFVRPRFFVIGENSTIFQQPVLIPRGNLMLGVHFL